jgi:hypothetical protein
MVPYSFPVTIFVIMMDIIFLLVLLYLYNYLVMISFWQVFIFKNYFEELEEESQR